MTDLNEQAQSSVSRRKILAGSLGMAAAVTLSNRGGGKRSRTPLSAPRTIEKEPPQ
jgi:hypothetical protein